MPQQHNTMQGLAFSCCVSSPSIIFSIFDNTIEMCIRFFFRQNSVSCVIEFNWLVLKIVSRMRHDMYLISFRDREVTQKET